MKAAAIARLAAVLVVVSAIAGCNESNVAPQSGSVRFEHVAINVPEPVAMAKWWCENLDMKVMRQGPPPANMRFIADADENMMMELYNNPPDAVPDYKSMDPLLLHIAFMVDDVDAAKTRLLAAGATVAKDIEVTPAGDRLVILRDPWGVPIQLLTRAEPMLKH